MDSSKFQPGSEECSRSESGWTKYIASPDDSDNDPDNDDHEEEEEEDRSTDEKESDEQDDEDEGSDDSMASDATSGPSDQYGHGLVQPGNKNERKITGKKQEKKQNQKQIKAAKDKSRCKDDGAGKSEKRY